MPPIPIKLEWQQKTIRIFVLGAGFKGVPAACLGLLAIHQSADVSPPHKDYWALTHVPTGRSILHLKNEDELFKIAEELTRRCKIPASKSHAQVLAELPAWVKPWIKQCKENNGYVKPT